ncbi:MAG: hypothetical protein ABW184_12415 [Sphingobium sp.]
MGFRRNIFVETYIRAGGTPDSARSYVSYLRRADALVGDIDKVWRKDGRDALVGHLERLPAGAFGSERNRRDSLSAIRRYVALLGVFQSPDKASEDMHQIVVAEPILASVDVGATDPEQIGLLLKEAQNLAARYYAVTGKPLGMTGEIAELAAAETLGLELAPPRTAGYDALYRDDGVVRRVQIKGRAVDPADPYRGRCPSIKCGDLFDDVLLVLLDRSNMQLLEIWRSDEPRTAERLAFPGSKSRNERSSMGISQFKSIAIRIWDKATGPLQDAWITPIPPTRLGRPRP